jgi:hypothetical protein
MKKRKRRSDSFEGGIALILFPDPLIVDLPRPPRISSKCYWIYDVNCESQYVSHLLHTQTYSYNSNLQYSSYIN